MSQENPTGRCLCGAVSYTVRGKVEQISVCHCTMCRRWSGGIHLGFEAAPDALELQGSENLTRYTSSAWAERAFCKTCGSHLFYRLTMEGPAHGVYAVCAGSLDEPNGLPLSKEIFVDHKPDGFDFAGDHPRMTEAEFLASIGMGPPAG